MSRRRGHTAGKQALTGTRESSAHMDDDWVIVVGWLLWTMCYN